MPRPVQHPLVNHGLNMLANRTPLGMIIVFGTKTAGITLVAPVQMAKPAPQTPLHVLAVTAPNNRPPFDFATNNIALITHIKLIV